MAFIRFSADRDGFPLFHVDDDKYRALGAWLTADISKYMQVCLDALAIIDDVANGRPPFEEWTSENYDVAITPQGVSFSNRWVEGDSGRYTVDEVREALEAYWRFLSSLPESPYLVREYRPDLPEWKADLLSWEETWERTHPYRGRLF